MAIGRISGPLLKANLLREGVDLAFETNLLYLDVNNSRVGINNASPQYDLDVTGTTRTPGLQVSGASTIGAVQFSGNTISTTSPTLVLGTADNVVYNKRLTIDTIDITDNIISTNASNANTSLGFGHSAGVEPLPFIYEIKKQLNTNVSLKRNIHIIAFPQ